MMHIMPYGLLERCRRPNASGALQNEAPQAQEHLAENQHEPQNQSLKEKITVGPAEPRLSKSGLRWWICPNKSFIGEQRIVHGSYGKNPKADEGEPSCPLGHGVEAPRTALHSGAVSVTLSTHKTCLKQAVPARGLARETPRPLPFAELWC